MYNNLLLWFGDQKAALIGRNIQKIDESVKKYFNKKSRREGVHPLNRTDDKHPSMG